MAITLNTRLTLPDDVVTRTLDGETVILDVATGTYFGLDPVGARFLELLSADGDLAAVHRTMLDEFDVAPERLEADLIQLCEEMIAKGLLQQHDSSA